MEEYRIVGKGVPRVDGPAKATGKAWYTVDVNLPGMLYGKILRSPYPHAKILQIDTTQAKNLPGVKAVITGKDLKDVRYAFVDTPRYPADEQPLAVDKVRYVGDEVAAVAAETEAIAEEALSLIKVDYEVLPAVFTAEEAVSDDAPVIHEAQAEGSTAWEDWGVAQKKGKEYERNYNNESGHTFVAFGDIEKGYEEADYIREDTFETKATAHCQMEPHAAVASFDHAHGKLDVWLSTQGIFLKRNVLSKGLNLAPGKIRVHHTYVGGAFGGKIDLFPYEYCTAYLAIKTGRPVKIELEREEVFMTTRQRHPTSITIKTGVKNDGSIVAQDIRVMADNGAYRGSGPVVIFLCHGFSFPVYDVPNYRYEGFSVYTNNPIRGPQRGHGAPQVRFAIDSHLDLIARDLNIDPVDIMKKNVRHQGDVLPNGDVLNSCGISECIDDAVEAVGWKDKRQQFISSGGKDSRYQRGVGISLCAMFSGAMYYPFASASIIKLNDDGSAVLFTGAQDIGQGSYTTLSQVLAEELEIPMEDVHVVAGDTELCPIDLGSFLSGTALVTGSAVKKAAADAKQQVLEGAADILGIDDPGGLEARDKMIYLKEDPRQNVSYQQAIQACVLRKGGNPVIGRGYYKGYEKTDRYPSLAKGKGLFTGAYGFAAQAAEVEVDTWTGKVKLLKAVTVHDCGYPLNKTIVEGQIHGCASMGAGQALSEEIYLENGQLFNPSFLGYRLPISTDTPQMIDGIVSTDEPSGPFGAKEVGEGSVAGMLGAVANAVHDAVGIRIKSLPITPEKVLLALKDYDRNAAPTAD